MGYLATVNELYILRVISFAQYDYWSGWMVFVWGVVVVINALCMFLSFDFAARFYYKLCGPLNRCCFECCKRCVARRVQNHVMKQTELVQPLISTDDLLL